MRADARGFAQNGQVDVGDPAATRGKAAGRGAYLCPKAVCLKKAQKNRALERAFDVPIPAEIYEQLAAELEVLGDG